MLKHIRHGIYLLCCFIALSLASCEESDEDLESEFTDMDSLSTNLTPDTISVTELEDMMKLPGYIVLDVRSVAEYDSISIPNSLNLDVNSGQFEENLKILYDDHTYLVHSNNDTRAGKAVEILKKNGFKAILVKGGIKQWQAEGKRVINNIE